MLGSEIKSTKIEIRMINGLATKLKNGSIYLSIPTYDLEKIMMLKELITILQYINGDNKI